MLKLILLFWVRAYQVIISPLKPPTCRYLPSCSGYAREVLETHPPFAAIRLIFRRLGSCHPWGGYGYDPPPKPPENTEDLKTCKIRRI
ncbi:MAG TPA: membrane protein insertion efficiency factor YidD [Alphaproteobacteria bacterium]|nr:membrane protein insertion efficiency factor YidD [Rhodospirillaceae bacterium]HRJ12514.1 membrane protein insertion efficiency factor YidD [Alphaproteobacteria bacterium]